MLVKCDTALMQSCPGLTIDDEHCNDEKLMITIKI